jgi:hypothetical protein
MATRLALALFSASMLSAISAFAADRADNALTIYSSAAAGAVPPEIYRGGGQHGYTVPGYATVRHERDMDLTAGRNEVRFTSVAGLIDPTTVSFESITDPVGTRVVEQNFQFDLVSTEKLLERFIDQPIDVEQMRGNERDVISGTLLSTTGGIVLREPSGSVRTLSYHSGVRLPSLPGGLITRPTLVWNLAAKKAGTHRARVGYQTGGMTWWTDYNLSYAEGANAKACSLTVGAWVSILNQSGASYPDARLKLVAGDVHRAPVAPASAPMAMGRAKRSEMAEEDKGFAEKSFFEYHLYTLGALTSLPDNSTKQIELFPVAKNVPCVKTLVYYGQDGGYYGMPGSPATDRNYGISSNHKVDSYLSFKNSEQNNMGMPLPAGRVRVSKMDTADGSMEFIGEDRIDHTPRNETLLFKLGSAFDVVGERRQVDFNVDTKGHVMTEEIEVKVRNRKSEPVEVIVKENLYRWTNWKVIQTSQNYSKQDARTLHFPVTIAADQEATVRYTVRYTW